MSIPTNWHNASTCSPPHIGWYNVKTLDDRLYEMQRAYWDGKAWRYSDRQCDQFVRIRDICQFCLKLEKK